MKRFLPLPLLALLAGVLGFTGLLAWTSTDGADEEEDLAAITAAPLAARPGESEEDFEARRQAELEALWDREYPLHGLVTGLQIQVHGEPDGDAQTIGWLRLGGRVRLKSEPQVLPRCASGWYEVWPRGHVCAGLGVEVSEEASEAPEADSAAAVDEALPYRYLVAREPQVPEYHRLPSRDEQRAALAHARRYVEMLNAGQERRAGLLRNNGLANEPRNPAVVARYLQRGFWVAGAGVEVRAFRRFVRTVRGAYIKEAQLIEETGSDFAGVELDDENTLPIAWARRAGRPMTRVVRADGTERFVEGDDVIERQTRVPWVGRERFGTRSMHVLEGERYLREWFVSVAERREPPAGVAENEPWVHVDLGAQTLVLYVGATPTYATVISSGIDEHDTPLGEYRIRRKLVSDTMADVGDSFDDNYRIEDVPWTQYFEGSFALHGAFWHSRFGLERSHGCVNIAPKDARYVFEHTWPEVPEGWHGVSTERTGFQGSLVLVTE